MKIGTHYISREKNGPRFFDGTERENAELSFLCGACESKISFDVWEYFKDERKRSMVELAHLKKTLGDATFLSVKKCTKCSHSHLVYFDFAEVQHQRWCGTLRGVCEVIT